MDERFDNQIKQQAFWHRESICLSQRYESSFSKVGVKNVSKMCSSDWFLSNANSTLVALNQIHWTTEYRQEDPLRLWLWPCLLAVCLPTLLRLALGYMASHAWNSAFTLKRIQCDGDLVNLAFTSQLTPFDFFLLKYSEK